MTLQESIDKLARHGITVGSDGKLDQDRSIHLFDDGHLYDFGRSGHYYRDVEHLLKERPDIIGAPVQAKSYKGTTAARWTPETLAGLHQSHYHQLKQLQGLGGDHYQRALTQLLPLPWWKEPPACLGYDFKNKTLTVSAMDGEKVEAICYRRSRNKDGDEVKWKTYGSKKFIPMKLTGKDEVWLASGMGELVMLELLGVDYICLQSDGMAKYLPMDLQIEHLVILPDNDESFRRQIPHILRRLRPVRASMVEWKHQDPREAAWAYETPETFILEAQKHRVGLEVPRSDYDELDLSDSDLTFARLFAKVTSNQYGWSPNRQLFINWAFLHSVFVEAMNGEKVSRAVTMGAGEGKSKGTALFVATEIARQDKSALIVVNLRTNGYEMVEDINTWSGTNAAKMLDSAKEDFETSKTQVLVITHKRLQITLHGKGKKSLDDLLLFNSTARDLIVIDEAIDLRKNHTITVQQLSHLASTANLINPKNSEQERFSLAWFAKVLHDNIGKPAIYDMPERPKKVLTEFPILRSAIISRAGDRPDPFIGRPWSDLFDDIEALMVSRHYRVRTGNSTFISTAQDFMPKNASPVILDASADVDEIYRQYQQKGLMKIIQTKQVRRYDKATLHFIRAKTSKREMLKDKEPKEDVISAIEQFIDEKTGPTDKVLIISHKDVAKAIDLLPWRHDVTVMSWGDITGRNDARECNKVFIFGLPHKPRVVDLNKMYAINEIVDDKELEGDYRNSAIVAEVYQAIMRSALRIPQQDGGCIPTDIYLTVPDQKGGTSAQLRETLMSELPRKLSGIKAIEWNQGGEGVSKLFGADSFYLCKVPNDVRLLTPTMKKLRGLLSDKTKMAKLMEKSRYRGMIAKKDIAKALKVSDRSLTNTMKSEISKELCRLEGWLYGHHRTINLKDPKKREVGITGFFPVLED